MTISQAQADQLLSADTLHTVSIATIFNANLPARLASVALPPSPVRAVRFTWNCGYLIGTQVAETFDIEIPLYFSRARSAGAVGICCHDSSSPPAAVCG
jgi:hypothetical protein